MDILLYITGNYAAALQVTRRGWEHFCFRSPNGGEKGEGQIEDVFWEKGRFTG